VRVCVSFATRVEYHRHQSSTMEGNDSMMMDGSHGYGNNNSNNNTGINQLLDGTGLMGSTGMGGGTMSSTFKTRHTAKTGDELRKARESRASEALKMKDEQLKILSDQNVVLLQNLDKVEEEANTIQMEKLAIEQENRSIRDNNFELQSKARAAETQAKRMAAEVADKDRQLRIMTDQNSELLRLLESEESLTAQLQNELSEIRTELDEIRQKYGALLMTAKSHEELATKAAREGQLRAEEIRLLRAETEQLKQVNAELKMKTQVEVEALQEQLRVRKEKQYQLLEKLQAQEEAKRQAEDQVAGMEEQLRGLHARTVELETQLQVEMRAKQNLEEVNKELQTDNGNLFGQNKELHLKIEKSEKERLRMEAEARDSGEQLREMAEKVFQLLERLKLAELGKTKAMEALKKKEQDMVGLQKKNARLIKEATEEGRAKVKAEMDVKVLQEQVRALKKNNASLAQRSKEEASDKVQAVEEAEKLRETLKTNEARLSYLLNKVAADEEARMVQLDDRKKLEAQVLSFNEKCEELQHKLTEMGESNRVITQAMRLKQEELNALNVKYDALVKEMETRDLQESMAEAGGSNTETSTDHAGAKTGAPDDIDNVRLNEGRGRFYIEAKSVGGGSMLVLRARKPTYKDWLDKHGVNDFLKRSQKTTRFRDMVVERVAMAYGLLMVEEEEKDKILGELNARDKQIDHLQRKLAFVQDSIATEEDAKRRMLLRYIHAVKEHAIAANDGTGGVLQLAESNINDEEVHALSALLRNNMNIDELNLRGNNITDDGARALGAVLSGRSSLRLIDLRGNKIGKGAIRILAEALERSERVRHVYVHAGGKIEALGAGRWNSNTAGINALKTGGDSDLGTSGALDPKLMVTVETVCVVDVRDNNPKSAMPSYELMEIADHHSNNGTGGANRTASPERDGGFRPVHLLASTNAPPRGVVSNAVVISNSVETPTPNLENW
jgi:chromosome segregation ATPase